MTSIHPTLHLPENLSKKAYCAICTSPRLHVIHIPNQPDEVVCSYCHARYEIAMNSNFVRLISLPKSLDSRLYTPLLGKWYILSRLRRRFQEIRTGTAQNSTDDTSENDPGMVLRQDLVEQPFQSPDENDLLENSNSQFATADEPIYSTNDLKTGDEEVDFHKEGLKRIDFAEVRFWVLVTGAIIMAAVLFYWVLWMIISPKPALSVQNQVAATIAVPSRPAATMIPLQLSDNATKFFLTLWGLHGSTEQKAQLMEEVKPPEGLEADAANIAKNYRILADGENAYYGCLQANDQKQSLCDSEQKTYRAALEQFNLFFASECPILKDYYARYNEPWPSPAVCLP